MVFNVFRYRDNVNISNLHVAKEYILTIQQNQSLIRRTKKKFDCPPTADFENGSC